MSSWLKHRHSRKLASACAGMVIAFTVAYVVYFRPPPFSSKGVLWELPFQKSEYNFTDSDNVIGFQKSIVPNIVHFIQFGKSHLEFVEAVCIRAAYLHQRPDLIYVHTDAAELHGKYWDMVKDIPVLVTRHMDAPRYIFGKRFSWIQHASDVARMLVLMQYGGIYLDKDSYLVKSLDPFLKYEMSLGWPEGQYLGTQALVAHKDARFLRLWHDSYHDYQSGRWYYNAGELPTTKYLIPQPHLVHRVRRDFGVHELYSLLYRTRSNEWKSYYVIHLLARLKPRDIPEDTVHEFDEENIKTYNKSFGAMARLVLYGTEDFIASSDAKPRHILSLAKVIAST